MSIDPATADHPALFKRIKELDRRYLEWDDAVRRGKSPEVIARLRERYDALVASNYGQKDVH